MSRENTTTHEPSRSERAPGAGPVIGDAHGSIEQSRGSVRLETAGGLPIARTCGDTGNPWCSDLHAETVQGDDVRRSLLRGDFDTELEPDQRTLLRLGANGF